MGRFKLDHLVDEYLVAECGFDAFVGFFVSCFDARRTKPYLVYDRMQRSYNHERPLLAALQLLEARGFIVCLDEALLALEDPEQDELPSGVKRTIEVVMRFKGAAD